jgi:hypothetical protein
MKAAARPATKVVAMLVASAALLLASTNLLASAGLPAQATPLVAPFAAADDGAVASPWRIVTLPKIPRHTQYRVVTVDGRPAVRAEAQASYGNLLLAFGPPGVAVEAAPTLRWRWRVDRLPERSDLTTRAGDDVAAKVCVLFDLPLARLGLADRLRIELGRRLFDPALPAATLCYVWDRTLARGSWLPNIYTDRVRMLVLRSAAAGDQGAWFEERRDLRADFRRAFGPEAEGGVPAITALAVASDTDNTGGAALAFFADITLERE